MGTCSCFRGDEAPEAPREGTHAKNHLRPLRALGRLIAYVGSARWQVVTLEGYAERCAACHPTNDVFAHACTRWVAHALSCASLCVGTIPHTRHPKARSVCACDADLGCRQLFRRGRGRQEDPQTGEEWKDWRPDSCRGGARRGRHLQIPQNCMWRSHQCCPCQVWQFRRAKFTTVTGCSSRCDRHESGDPGPRSNGRRSQ